MNNGWIKLHRKFRDWEWYQDSKTVHLLLHLLLLANHKTKYWQGNIIKSGQLITGRKSLSKETGISEQSIRTILAKLERSGVISLKSTNKFSLITIEKWIEYQIKEDELTNNQPATNQQLTTNKNDKNVKNDKKPTLATIKKSKHLKGFDEDDRPVYLVKGKLRVRVAYNGNDEDFMDYSGSFNSLIQK